MDMWQTEFGIGCMMRVIVDAAEGTGDGLSVVMGAGLMYIDM